MPKVRLPRRWGFPHLPLQRLLLQLMHEAEGLRDRSDLPPATGPAKTSCPCLRSLFRGQLTQALYCEGDHASKVPHLWCTQVRPCDFLSRKDLLFTQAKASFAVHRCLGGLPFFLFCCPVSTHLPSKE